MRTSSFCCVPSCERWSILSLCEADGVASWDQKDGTAHPDDAGSKRYCSVRCLYYRHRGMNRRATPQGFRQGVLGRHDERRARKEFWRKQRSDISAREEVNDDMTGPGSTADQENVEMFANAESGPLARGDTLGSQGLRRRFREVEGLK